MMQAESRNRARRGTAAGLDDLERDVASLPALDTTALRQRWKALFGADPWVSGSISRVCSHHWIPPVGVHVRSVRASSPVASAGANLAKCLKIQRFDGRHPGCGAAKPSSTIPRSTCAGACFVRGRFVMSPYEREYGVRPLFGHN